MDTQLVQLLDHAKSHVVSYAFSRSKNIPMVWHCLAKPCWIWLVNLSKKSRVDQFFLKQNSLTDIDPLVSWCQTNLVLIIFSNSFHTQLVKAIGL